MSPGIPAKWQWFPEARFGLFIHWGAYSAYGHGEQPLFREHLDQASYAARLSMRTENRDRAACEQAIIEISWQ